MGWQAPDRDYPMSTPSGQERLNAAILAEIAQDKGVEPAAIEIWFADEARIGQKNKITRRWARRGTRPAAPSDQRTASTYIFGAICPALGKGAALILPRCNTAAMNLHLAEIATAVAPRLPRRRSSSTRRDGTCRTSSPYLPTSRSCRCRRNAPNSHGGLRFKGILTHGAMIPYTDDVYQIRGPSHST